MWGSLEFPKDLKGGRNEVVDPLVEHEINQATSDGEGDIVKNKCVSSAQNSILFP